jgi:hypothetical protein
MSIKVSTKHPQYDASIYVWRLVRDFVAGQASVKRQNSLYLPIPAAMTAVKTPTDASTEQREHNRVIGGFSPGSTRSGQQRIDSSVPWYYPTNLAYQSYLRRARVPDMTSFALRALLGVSTRKRATVELPASIAYLEEKITPDGFDIYELFTFMISQILQTGRIGVLLDVNPDNKFTFKLYSSDACINWKEKVSDGDRRLSFVVLQEDGDKDIDNIFSHEVEAKYFVLCTDAEGDYKVDEYSESGGDNPINAEPVVPSILGKKLKKLPFIFAGSIDNTPDVDEAPLQGVADLAQHIYMKGADLANAEFMTCNPTLVMTGVEADESPHATGSNVVISISNDSAKVFYTDTDTSGLDHVLNHINSLKDEASAFGATLMGSMKKSAESAEAKKLDQSIGGATLQSAVMSAGSAIETMLNLALEWSGSAEVAVFEPSTEFANISLSSQEMAAMMNSYLQGTMSLETLVEQHRRAGLLPDGDSVEDEIARIQATAVGQAEDFDDLDDEDEEDESRGDEDEGTDPEDEADK